MLQLRHVASRARSLWANNQLYSSRHFRILFFFAYLLLTPLYFHHCHNCRYWCSIGWRRWWKNSDSKLIFTTQCSNRKWREQFYIMLSFLDNRLVYPPMSAFIFLAVTVFCPSSQNPAFQRNSLFFLLYYNNNNNDKTPLNISFYVFSTSTM